MNYQLEKYKGRSTRHQCPQCSDPHSFTLYVDENGEPFSEFDICSMSGHQPGSIAINRYRAVSDERKRKMIDAL